MGLPSLCPALTAAQAETGSHHSCARAWSCEANCEQRPLTEVRSPGVGQTQGVTPSGVAERSLTEPQVAEKMGPSPAACPFLDEQGLRCTFASVEANPPCPSPAKSQVASRSSWYSGRGAMKNAQFYVWYGGPHEAPPGSSPPLPAFDCVGGMEAALCLSPAAWRKMHCHSWSLLRPGQPQAPSKAKTL